MADREPVREGEYIVTRYSPLGKGKTYIKQIVTLMVGGL